MPGPEGLVVETRGRRQVAALLVSLVFAPLLASAFAQSWELRVCASAANLPYSNSQEEGFENRIANLLAESIGAEAVFVWVPHSPRAQLRDALMESAACDVLMGVNDGHPEYLTTIAYYRSSYVFVYHRDGPVTVQSFDDPELREMTIGVLVSGGGLSPPEYALMTRDLIENQVSLRHDYDQSIPSLPLIEAVADGDVDVAIGWGPSVGFAAAQHEVEFEVVPVQPQIEMPFVPMVAPIAIGLRPGDESLRDALNIAIADNWEAIERILEEYHVPLEPLPRPSRTAPGG